MSTKSDEPDEVDDPTPADGIDAPPGLGTISVTGGVLAAALASHGAIGAGLAAGLAPAAAALFQKAIDEWRHQQHEKASKLLTEAARHANMGVEEFLETIGNDPAHLTTLFNAVEAATRTNLDAKIKLLGKVLSEATLSADSALIAQDALLIATIADLEAPHIEILNIVAHSTKRAPRGGDWSGISERDIVKVRPGMEGSYSYSPLQLILKALERNGLIYQTGLGAIWDENMADDVRPDAGTNEWAITIAGRSLLNMLSEQT